jgi:hypothetical protein
LLFSDPSTPFGFSPAPLLTVVQFPHPNFFPGRKYYIPAVPIAVAIFALFTFKTQEAGPMAMIHEFWAMTKAANSRKIE